jgi:hypothetical protein
MAVRGGLGFWMGSLGVEIAVAEREDDEGAEMMLGTSTRSSWKRVRLETRRRLKSLGVKERMSRPECFASESQTTEVKRVQISLFSLADFVSSSSRLGDAGDEVGDVACIGCTSRERIWRASDLV